MIDEALLRHLYRYDRSLPLLATSERDPARDPKTRQALDDLVVERVTFGSTHDERVLGTITKQPGDEPRPAVIIQHGSTTMGRFRSVDSARPNNGIKRVSWTGPKATVSFLGIRFVFFRGCRSRNVRG